MTIPDGFDKSLHSGFNQKIYRIVFHWFRDGSWHSPSEKDTSFYATKRGMMNQLTKCDNRKVGPGYCLVEVGEELDLSEEKPEWKTVRIAHTK